MACYFVGVWPGYKAKCTLNWSLFSLPYCSFGCGPLCVNDPVRQSTEPEGLYLAARGAAAL